MDYSDRAILFPSQELRNANLCKQSISGIKQQIYIATPIPNYLSRAYGAARKIIEARHPNDCLIQPHERFHSNRHWRESYKDLLLPVSILYVLPDLFGTVGFGVVSEVEYLFGLQHEGQLQRAFAFAPGLSITTRWALVQRSGGADWTRYASLHVAPPRQRFDAFLKEAALHATRPIRLGVRHG